MANGAYKMKQGKDYPYPEYLKESEVSPLWVDAFLNTLPKNTGQKYLDDLGLDSKVTDIRKEFDAGRLKMYANMHHDAYNTYGNTRGVAGYGSDLSKTTGGYYMPRTTATDTSRILINPRYAGRESDTVPHEFWHEVMGHTLGDKGRVPELTTYDKADKALHGWLPSGAYPTEKQAHKKYGHEAETFLNQIYNKDYHPMTTGIEFEKNIGKPWLANMPLEMRGQLIDHDFPMKYNNDTQIKSNENPLLAGTVKKDGDIIKSVRGWIKNTVPWMKRGEGLIPDDIYKQGSWFGSQGSYDPNNPIIRAGEKLGRSIY